MAKETQKTVLEQNFNYGLNQESPVQPDYSRKVNYDGDGNEFITYEEIDYPKVQRSLGKWTDWSLESLIKAGIDPAFPIHTGMNTRLEGVDAVNQMVADVNALFDSSEKKED